MQALALLLSSKVLAAALENLVLILTLSKGIMEIIEWIAKF